ncbi:hypothetical protein HK096_006375 [Nowakowskiella sp. JEL0078]|nr:hypothetical protein HK096_006375 [Nowakowskiella sp. JEL0078]
MENLQSSKFIPIPTGKQLKPSEVSTRLRSSVGLRNSTYQPSASSGSESSEHSSQSFSDDSLSRKNKNGDPSQHKKTYEGSDKDSEESDQSETEEEPVVSRISLKHPQFITEKVIRREKPKTTLKATRKQIKFKPEPLKLPSDNQKNSSDILNTDSTTFVELDGRSYVRNRMLMIHNKDIMQATSTSIIKQMHPHARIGAFIPKPHSSTVINLNHNEITPNPRTNLDSLKSENANPISPYWRKPNFKRIIEPNPQGTFGGAVDSLLLLESKRPITTVLENVHPKLWAQAKRIYGDFSLPKDLSIETNPTTITGININMDHSENQTNPKKNIQSRRNKELKHKKSSKLLDRKYPSENDVKSSEFSNKGDLGPIFVIDKQLYNSQQLSPPIDIPPPDPLYGGRSSLLKVTSPSSNILHQLTTTGVIDPHLTQHHRRSSLSPIPTQASDHTHHHRRRTHSRDPGTKLRLSHSEMDLFINATGAFRGPQADAYTRFLMGARNIRLNMPGIGEIVWKTGRSRRMVASLNSLALQITAGNTTTTNCANVMRKLSRRGKGGKKQSEEASPERTRKSETNDNEKDSHKKIGFLRNSREGLSKKQTGSVQEIVVDRPPTAGLINSLTSGTIGASNANCPPKKVTILGTGIEVDQPNSRRSGFSLSYLRVVNPAKYRRALKMEELRKQVIRKIENLEELRI